MDARKKSDAAIPPDGHEPIPPRFWWLKRIGIGVGVLIVSLVVLRIWWGWEADRRLQAEIDRIVASGEPFYPEDYVEDVPDELNAGLLYKKAAAAYVAPPVGTMDLVDVSNDFQEFEKHRRQVRLLLEQNAAALALLRKARELPSVNWRDSTDISVGLASAGRCRELGKLLRAAAFSYYRKHDYAPFIETIRDTCALSAAQAKRATVIGLLVGMAIEALILDLIEDHGMTIKLDPEPPFNGQMRGVSRSAIETLIRDLLDDAAYRRAIVLASYGERTIIYGQYTGMLAGRAGMTWTTDWFADVLFDGPLLKLEAARDLRSGGSSLLAALEPTWPAGEAIYGKKAMRVPGIFATFFRKLLPH